MEHPWAALFMHKCIIYCMYVYLYINEDKNEDSLHLHGTNYIHLLVHTKVRQRQNMVV